jgi:hypothetical protein
VRHGCASFPSPNEPGVQQTSAAAVTGTPHGSAMITVGLPGPTTPDEAPDEIQKEEAVGGASETKVPANLHRYRSTCCCDYIVSTIARN